MAFGLTYSITDFRLCVLWKIWRCGGPACSVRRTFVLFLRFSEGRRQTRETRHARDEKREKKTHFVFALLISRMSRLACFSPQLSNAKKFDACSVRYIMIGSMVRGVSAKTWCTICKIINQKKNDFSGLCIGS